MREPVAGLESRPALAADPPPFLHVHPGERDEIAPVGRVDIHRDDLGGAAGLHRPGQRTRRRPDVETALAAEIKLPEIAVHGRPEVPLAVHRADAGQIEGVVPEAFAWVGDVARLGVDHRSDSVPQHASTHGGEPV